MWRQGLDQLRSGVRDFSQSALLEARQTLQEVGWRQSCTARRAQFSPWSVCLLWFELARPAHFGHALAPMPPHIAG